MLQDIAPQVYHNEMYFGPRSPEDIALVCTREGVLMGPGEALELPRVGQVTDPGRWIYGFSVDRDRYWLCLDGGRVPGYSFRNAFREKAPRVTAFAAAVGQSLTRWYGDNRFCGTCGGTMEPSAKERALCCPACGRTAYPKICPGIIAAVCDGDRILLTRYAGRAFTRYALVAGFCEIGETVEQTVHREILEETGLRVRNLRFYKSQPWVVSDTLLMGFFADLDGADSVRLQEDELSEGTWFSRQEIPTDHSGDSLTGEMIELFREGREPR